MDITTTTLICIQALLLAYIAIFTHINDRISKENWEILDRNSENLRINSLEPLEHIVITVWCYPFQKLKMSDGTLRKNKAS